MKKVLTTGLLAGLMIGLGGCGSSNTQNVSFRHINNNLTPELMTLNERPVDVARAMGYTSNVSWRMFWEDLGRTFYTDHPPRLNPVEVPYVSGKPR